MESHDLQAAIAAEKLASAELRSAAQAFADRIKPHAWLIAHWGDGNGSGIIDSVREALEASGVISAPSLRTPPAYTKAKISHSVRHEVFERDAYRCVRCRSHVDLTLDHIMPESKGGPSVKENLQTMCRSCNSSKGVA